MEKILRELAEAYADDPIQRDRPGIKRAYLEGAKAALEMAAGNVNHKAFLCHAHDDHGKGRERGLLDAETEIRNLMP